MPSKQREGFQQLTPQELVREAVQVFSNDSGQRNVELGSGAYVVSEETRRFGSNFSLQSVAFLSVDGTQVAMLESIQGKFETRLLAMDNGRVILNTAGKSRDITDDLAQAGLTAADIRRTQQDIAADGEISRPEQVTIKNMIDKAASVAFKGKNIV